LLSLICKCLCQRSEEDVFNENDTKVEDNEIRSDDFFRDLDLYYLGELLKKARKELVDWENEPINSLKFDEQWRYPQEATFVATTITERLQERIKYIEDTIDGHLKALHGQHQMHHFDGVDYDKKISWLY